MRVVGGHQGDSGFAGEAQQAVIDLLIHFQALILHLQEEVPFSENVAQAVSGVARVGFAVFHHRFGDFAAQAGGESDQSAGMLGEQLEIDARLVVKAIQEAGGDELDKVAVAFGVFAKQHQVIGAAGAGSFGVNGLVFVIAASHVDFAADDGLDALGGGLVKEIGGGEKIAVVGDGDSGHFAAGGLVDQLRNIAGSVQKTEVGVQMEMNEAGRAHRKSL